MENIVVAFGRESAQQKISRLLRAGGYAVSCCCATGDETVRMIRQFGGGIIICGFHLRDTTAEDLAQRVQELSTLLVISNPDNLALCQSKNIYKLPTPASRHDLYELLELIRRLDEKRYIQTQPPLENYIFPENRTETGKPEEKKRTNEDKELIQKAKALVMELASLTEPEAYRFLQKRSMDTGTKLVDTARQILNKNSKT